LELFKIVKELRSEGIEPTIADIMKRYRIETGTFISQVTVRRYLDDLCDMGFLEKATHPQDKRRNVYYPLEGGKFEKTIISIFNIISRRFSQKELENWFRKILTNRECNITVSIGYGEKYELKSEDEEAISKVAEKLYYTPFFYQYLSGEDSSSILEKKNEEAIKNENNGISNFPKARILGEAPEGFTCELCGKSNAEVVAEFNGRKICAHERCLKDAG
jgi:DNA-binding MarR family transcriptional regulator